MKPGVIKIAGMMAIAVTLVSFTMPRGWYVGGNKPAAYNVGIAKGGAHDGSNAGTIKSAGPVSTAHFGALMQAISPDKYMGQRIRMTGYMRAEQVKGWAGFWCRADGKTAAQSMAFDNMENRAVTGTTGWNRYSVVIDVPDGTTKIAFGALMAGTGQIWFDHIQFEIVNKAIPLTGYGKRTLRYDSTTMWTRSMKEYENPGFDE